MATTLGKEKNPKRIAAGKKRWAGVPKADRRKHMGELGKRGGPALWKKIREGKLGS